MENLISNVTRLMQAGLSPDQALDAVLAAVLAHFHSETGTLHRLDAEKQLLQLVAQKGLPPALLSVVQTIPAGKGIAGQVIAQGRPVAICNLQNDPGGIARPGARQTGVGGALCVPIRRDGVICGTLGVGTVREHEYTPEETALLEEIGRLIAPLCGP